MSDELWNQSKDADLPKELQSAGPVDDIPTQQELNDLLRPPWPPEGYYSRIMLESWDYTEPTLEKPWGGYNLVLQPVNGPQGIMGTVTGEGKEVKYQKIYLRIRRVFNPDLVGDSMLADKLRNATKNNIDEKTVCQVLQAAGVDWAGMFREGKNWSQVLQAGMGGSIAGNVVIAAWQSKGKSGENLRIQQIKPGVV